MTGTNWRRENKRAKIPRESITSVGTHTRKTQHRSARSLTAFFLSILAHCSGERFAYVYFLYFLRFLVSFSRFTRPKPHDIAHVVATD